MANKEVLDKLRALKIDRTTDLHLCQLDGPMGVLETLAKSWLEEARLTSTAQIKGGVSRAKELTAAAALVELELVELRKRADTPTPSAPEVDEWADQYPWARIEHAVRPSSAHPEPGWSAKCVEPSCPGFWRTGFAEFGGEDLAKLTYEKHWTEKHHEPNPEPTERLSPSPELGEHRPSEFGTPAAATPGPGGRCAVGNVHDEHTLKCACGYGVTLAGAMALELSQGALNGFRERVQNGNPTFNLGPVSGFCPDCDADTHRCRGCGADVPHGMVACNLCSVEYPPGTPEHEAYATELRVELDKFAKGQEPYPYPSFPSSYPTLAGIEFPANDGSAVLAIDITEQRAHETIDQEYAHVTAEPIAFPFREAQAPPSRATPWPVNAPDAYSWEHLGVRPDGIGIPEHVSPSQLSTMDKCPAQARMGRYDGAPGIPLWSAVGGTAFHKVAEWIERCMVPSNLDDDGIDKRWSAAFHQAIAEEFAKGHGIPMDDWYASNRGKENYSWWLAEGGAMVRRWVEFRRTYPDYEILVLPDGRPVIELELMLIVDGAPPVKVILDSAWKLPNGDIEIIDYKTGSRMDKDTIQLGTQAHALVDALQSAPPIYARYFDARKGVLTEPLEAMKRHPLVELQMRYADLDDRRRNRPALPKRSDLCVACPVRYLCPAYAQ